jgi:hypothetical protein
MKTRHRSIPIVAGIMSDAKRAIIMPHRFFKRIYAGRHLLTNLVGPVIIAVFHPTTHARPDQNNNQDDECAVE